METIAVYWEPVIITYGFQKRSNLSLIKLMTLQDRLADVGLRLMGLKGDGVAYEFSMLKGLGSTNIELFLLAKKQWENNIATVFQNRKPEYIVETMFPVDLVFFQGPHFGDRYGIADAACHALLSNGIVFLLASFSGASIHLVFADGVGEKAIAALGEAFQTPG